MNQFQVPQFITVEDKVFGPFTIKQFLYLAGGGMFILGIRVFLVNFLFWPASILIASMAASLAFLKINEQPFPLVLKHAVFYFLRPRLYVWKKEPSGTKTITTAPAIRSGSPIRNIPRISESKLSDLAWSLDIKQKSS